MLIENRQFRVRRSDATTPAELLALTEEMLGRDAFRWYIAQATPDEFVIEATICGGEASHLGDGRGRPLYPGRRTVLNLIPTGIGCSIGGYAGDAAPITNLLASTCDYLITNPNAVNASDFIGLNSNNIVYTEGSCIDLFCRGLIDLHLPYSNRIGVVVERTSDRHLDLVFNVINAVRAVHGVDILDYVITERPIGGRCVENGSGAFTGTLDNPEVLFDACEQLIKKGANAIAITSHPQDLPRDSYAKHFAGQYPNPVGGVEAIISFLVTGRFQVPAAHAPLTNIKELDLAETVVDARGAGEMTSDSGLACVLVGLRRAPQIQPQPNSPIADIININNLTAVVMPAGALGGVPAIHAQARGIPVIAVEQNETILNMTRATLNLRNVVEARSYAEAAGMLMALKSGISLESISRPLKTLRYERAESRAVSDAEVFLTAG